MSHVRRKVIVQTGLLLHHAYVTTIEHVQRITFTWTASNHMLCVPMRYLCHHQHLTQPAMARMSQGVLNDGCAILQVHVPDGPLPTEPSMRSFDDISHHGTQPRRRSTAASSHLPTQRPSPMPKTAPLNASTAWEPKFNTNGLAGYREPVEGTYATCFSIAATPTQVFQHLVVLPNGSTAWSFFEDVKVLAAPDSDDGATVRLTAKKLG